MELYSLSLKKAWELLESKKIYSIELTSSILKRIGQVEPKIESYLTITPEIAQEQARKADQLLKLEKQCWLTGVPAAIKDIIVTERIKTTAGSKILANFLPPYNATVIERLLSVAAVFLGKTNLDEFAMGASTENSGYKITKNPWDRSRVPGGSSGGSAAATAADLCIYSLGSDTGGSVRQPASFCGVVGLKPTYGRVSRYGLIAMASSLDQIGPITKTVEDAALVLNIIAGYDSFDSTSVKLKLPDFTKALTGKIKGLKIGIPKEYFDEGLEKGVKNTVVTAVKKLEELGANLVELSLPHTKEAISVYYLIMPSEVSTNLARFDGIRFGNEREKFGDEVKRRIMLGTYALSSGYHDAYYLRAAKVRTLIKKEFDKAFAKVDCLVGPVSPTTAFSIGEKINDPLQMYLADILTVPVSLAGLPAISVPCGFSNNLPVGLQIIGKQFAEEIILNLAHTYERANNWYKMKPKFAN